MRSAGGGFFWRFRLLAPCGSAIAPALHEQVDLGHKIHVGHKVYHTVLGPAVLYGGKKDVFLGKGPELRKVALLNAKHLQLLALPEQAGHVGLANQLFVVLGQRP